MGAAGGQLLDGSRHVKSWVKNAGLGFAIPYLHNGAPHEYLPDFIANPAVEGEEYLILETKGGRDQLWEVKKGGCGTLGARGKRRRLVRDLALSDRVSAAGYCAVSDGVGAGFGGGAQVVGRAA